MRTSSFKALLALAATLASALIAAPARASTIVPAGSVGNQHWVVAGSPYVVQGDVDVPQGQSLVVDAGVDVRFAKSAIGYALNVDGTLTVGGTLASPVTFESDVAAGYWRGILGSTTAKISVVGALVKDGETGVTSYGGAFIQASTFTNIGGNAIYDSGTSNAAPLTLDRVVVLNNFGNGVVVSDVGATISSSLIVGNGNSGQGGAGVLIISGNDASADIEGTTLYGNGTGVSLVGPASTVWLNDSILADGLSASSPQGVNIDYTDAIQFNFLNCGGVVCPTGAHTLFVDPMFAAPGSDFHLQSKSPLIDAGGPGGPAIDLDGNPRPLDGDGANGAQWDLGCYEAPSALVCGNGVINPGEVCDEGMSNGLYGHCKADCSGLGPHCGDGIVNGPEACDDGAKNGAPGDPCTFQCTPAPMMTASSSSSGGGGAGGASSSNASSSSGGGAGGASSSSASSSSGTSSSTASSSGATSTSSGASMAASSGAATGTATASSGSNGAGGGVASSGGDDTPEPGRSGCGCRVEARDEPSGAFAALLAFGAAIGVRRRARRPRSAQLASA